MEAHEWAYDYAKAWGTLVHGEHDSGDTTQYALSLWPKFHTLDPAEKARLDHVELLTRVAAEQCKTGVGQALAIAATDLMRRLNQTPPLEILDRVMEPHVGSDPDFERDPANPPQDFDDYLDPPSPLARLIASALAPDISDAEYLLLAGGPEAQQGPIFLAANEKWEAAIGRFGERYKLWGRNA